MLNFDSIPVTRKNGRVLATASPSVPNGPKADRPLDPAIDPDREYSYKTKKGGKAISVAYNGGQAARGDPTVGSGWTANDARATMVGGTVHIGPAAQTKTKSEHSEAPRAPREYEISSVSMGRWLMTYRTPVTVVLDDEAFLKVMNSMTAKPTFNQHIQEKSKPAPNSKAAALVEQAGKTTKRRAAATKKSESALARSIETSAEAYRQLEASNKLSNADATIRLAPTREFGFPPPNTKSGGKKVPGDSASVHTDGVESASTFNSADFKTQSSAGTGSRIDQDHGSIVTGGKLAQKVSSATSEAADGSNRSGIGLLPPPSHCESHQRDDLITLEDGIEQSSPDVKISSNDALSASYARSLQSPSIPHLMDEELDDDILQSSLTPRSSIAPRCITFRSARYIRCDQITSQDAEDSQVGIHSEGSCQQKTQPIVQAASFSSNTNNRIAVTNGLNIGLQTLQESSAGSILGEHNLPGRSIVSTGPSSQASVASSRWANGLSRSPLASASFPTAPLLQTCLGPVPSQQANQQNKPFQNSQTDDREIAAAPRKSMVQQKVASLPNLAASKYAIQGVQVATRPPPVESATFHKSTKTASVDQPDRRPNAFRTASPTASVDRRGEDKGAFETTLQVSPESLVPASRCVDYIPNMHSNALSKTESSPTDRTCQTTENGTASTPKPSRKQRDLTASIWSTANSEIETLVPSSKTFENQVRQSRSNLTPDNVDSRDETTAMSDNGAQRKRNPFGATTQSSKPTATENRKLASAVPVQPFDGPVMVERSGNIPDTNHTAMALKNFIEGTKANAKAQSSTFDFSESAGSRYTNPIQSSSAIGTKQGQSGTSGLHLSKTKPTNNPMASKYATSSSSTSSFRKVRRAKLDDLSSCESEI
ncbi:hypothetical protein GJ744_008992 [Endocarpon pusillum]|uniref:Uncharacterized protein n=1 Tax=Endocarpon pusillum TaxID=364733 RepID=A0A8H7APC7_9EURO|nr:hypothetical protein GJ744_008992 [Endocarpon pusillum]